MELIDRKEINVRFGEVDSMAIVWHGNYIKYFVELSYENIAIDDDLAPI